MDETEREKEYLWRWAERNHVCLDLDGELDIGQDCVGVRAGADFVLIEDDNEFFDQIAPQRARRSHRLAVRWNERLGVTQAAAIHQLYTWVRVLDASGMEVVYRSG